MGLNLVRKILKTLITSMLYRQVPVIPVPVENHAKSILCVTKRSMLRPLQRESDKT